MKSTVTANLDFPSLVKAHHAMVWRYLRLIGCEHAQAEDLTQEVFLAVLRKPPEQFSDAAVASYLRLVARNKFLDWVRRQGRIVDFDLDQAEQVWLEAERDDQGRAWMDSFRECLAALEGRARKVLHLRYHDDASIRMVAEAVGMKESGVKTLLGRLKQQLRQCVERKVAQS